jgi:replicative DNA helicase
MDRIETTILKNLLHNDEYVTRVVPFMDDTYFADGIDKIVFNSIKEFIEKYKGQPTNESLTIDIGNRKDISQKEHDDAIALIKELKESKDFKKPANMEWLIRGTEAFVQERAIHNAVMESIHIIGGESKTQEKGAIPGILQEALGISFDRHVGHDYMEDSKDRYDFYHTTEERIPFDLEYFNKITGGGLVSKSLTIAIAGTGVGKSLFMCHHASACLMSGLNVLYITMEMAEERIAERLDANLFDIPISEISNLPENAFDDKVMQLKKQTCGKLIIKEYPTAAANVSHFRGLIDELRMKKNFFPDIIFVDYLNICSSVRLRQSSTVNSYTYIKAIAEELRGLAMEIDVPVVSATQFNRTGFTNTDPGLEDTAESFGLPATADLMFAMVTSDQMEEMGQIMIKQLKNRYNDLNKPKRFVVGIDKTKMRLFDVSDAEQTLNDTGQIDDTPAFDKSDFGQAMFNEKDFRDWEIEKD